MKTTVFEAHEPSTKDLDLARLAYSVSLVSFSRELEKLEPNDILPRYHRITFQLLCLESCFIRPLYLTVRRNGSKIEGENFYTVPFFPDDLPIGAKKEYEILSFDSFNLPFEDMSVELCQPEDYQKRRVSKKHIERAKSFVIRKSG